MATKSRRGIGQVIQNVTGLFAPSVTNWKFPAKADYKQPVDIDVLPTGMRPLDKATGLGGIPFGTPIELIGPGTTTIRGGASCIAARIAARVQRRQGTIAIVDMTGSFDPWQADRCGLVASHLFLTCPQTVLNAITTLEDAAKNADFVIVVMDIVAELLQRVEPDLLKALLRRLNTIVSRSEGIFLFITAPKKSDPFDPANYPPGFALADIAALRLWVRDESWVYKDGLTTTYKASLTVIKNELGVPGKGADIRIKLSSPQGL